jgi:hypothetical protein
MNDWTSPSDITEQVRKKWASGQILKELLSEQGLFPMRIPLKKANLREMGERFSESVAWSKKLKAKSKASLGYGYIVIEEERNLRQFGRNSIPTYAIIENIEEALKLIEKQEKANLFCDFYAEMRKAFPSAEEEIRRWFIRFPKKALSHVDAQDKLIAALKWFAEHPRSGLYLRQLDIRGVDTKFIEGKKALLSELLEIVLPDNIASVSGSVQPGLSQNFEPKYGLQSKPATIRFRLLDADIFVQGLSDIQTPIHQFCDLAPVAETIFIAENEINGLSFPEMPKALVIFGLGYSVDILKSVPWLQNRTVYYWGDIDTHGFAILNRLRSFLPNAKSMLMDEETLLQNRDLWIREEKQFTGIPEYLTKEERKLFFALQDDLYAEKVRLEQERIPFAALEAELEALFEKKED